VVGGRYCSHPPSSTPRRHRPRDVTWVTPVGVRSADVATGWCSSTTRRLCGTAFAPCSTTPTVWNCRFVRETAEKGRLSGARRKRASRAGPSRLSLRTNSRRGLARHRRLRQCSLCGNPALWALSVCPRAPSMGILRSLWGRHSMAHVAWLTTLFRRDARSPLRAVGSTGTNRTPPPDGAICC
jgi:hypothetical protein